jgi:6-phospho-beta-glucosidase
MASPDAVRLVILGGSGAATPELADGLAVWPGGVERRPPLEIVLVSRSAEKLRLVVQETTRRTSGLAGAPVSVRGETIRRSALAGADVIVNAVRIGGLAARVFDETFPQKLGIPGEETMGPGGFANAVRTVPALAATWADIAETAPDALVINLTNPAGIVVAAAERQSGLRIVSMCDSPATLCDSIAARLGRPVAEVRRRYLGMNHVGWWVPESAGELAASADLAVGEDAGAVVASEAIGGPYLRYYLHPDRVLATQRAAGEVRAQQLQKLEATLMTGFAEGASDLPRRGAAWYTKAVLPLVDAWVNGTDEPIIVGMRNDGRIAGLPDAVTTEAPLSFPSPGVMTPLPAAELPRLPAAILARHAAFEALATDAVVGDLRRDDLVRAMLANPMVGSFDQARQLVEAILAPAPA